MAFLSSEVERLLAGSPAPLPLTKTGLRPEPGACGLRLREATTLFPGAQNSEAALAGLLLRLGCWTESHSVAQDVQSAEGSYWHGIIHRMEPDSANAGYWFRQTGKHPIFPELLRRTAEILRSGGPANWQLKPDWDPFLFLRWCEEAQEAGDEEQATAVDIQAAEWQLLFDWCAGQTSATAR
jgi:hypothetical protein